jgi:hypothetical protein
METGSSNCRTDYLHVDRRRKVRFFDERCRLTSPRVMELIKFQRVIASRTFIAHDEIPRV